MAQLFANDTIEPLRAYNVRYVILPIDRILGRVIRNPNYGGPSVGPFGWTWRPEISSANKPLFLQALQESIANDGIRNPILCWAFSEGIYLTFGGSRVLASSRCGRSTIPAIINDYTGEFSACPEVTPDNWATFFTDPPRDAEFASPGFDYHYNLERARRADHDPAGFAWTDTKNDWVRKEFSWIKEE